MANNYDIIVVDRIMDNKNFKKTILIDLDGVLNDYDGNFDKNKIPKIKKGSKTFLKKLSKNFDIKIFTTRNRLLTSKWLIENNLDEYIKEVTNKKENAYIYIDDRCIKFNGDFKEISKKIEDFKVYWK